MVCQRFLDSWGFERTSGSGDTASPSGILSAGCSCATVRPAKYRHEKPTQLSVRRGLPRRLEVTNAAAITFECVMLIMRACAGSWTDDDCVDRFAQLINGLSLPGGRGVVVLRVKGMTTAYWY